MVPHLCWGSKVSNVGFAQRHEHKHKHKLNGCEDVHNAQCKHKDKQYNHLCSSCAYAYVKLESAAVSISRNKSTILYFNIKEVWTQK